MKRVLTSVAAFLLVYFSDAQSGCPFIDVGPDINLPCTTPCTTLSATYFNTGATTSYSVSSIPYAPHGYAGTSVIANTDDVWSQILPLPFNFCFFGQSYSSIIIGSNGVISFNTANAGLYNTWNITGAAPGSTPSDLSNSIMAPWQDTDPTNEGSIYYSVQGTYPCRTFVISWLNVPYYGDPNSVSTGSCPNPLNATQQIVLYETTNVIDINIKHKDVCPNWNGGLAIEGIQSGGTFYGPTGRDATQWTAQNDAYRFTPNGPSIVSITWDLNGTPIGTGASITVCPTTYGLYNATATYLPCPGNQPVVVSDALFLNTSNLAVNIDSVHNTSCGQNNGTVYASYNTTSTVLDYGWDNGTMNTTTLNNLAPGTYIFHVDIAGCTRYDTAVVINSGFPNVTVDDSVFHSCNPPGNNGALCASVTGGASPYTYSWSNSQSGVCAVGLTAGNYSVTATDAGGCTASTSANVSYNFQSPSLGPPQITNVSCNGGNNGQIIVTPVNLQPPINYAWSGSASNSDSISGLTAATYSVIATDANGCTASGSYTVTEPSAITFGTPTITQVTCAAGGSIITNVSGGTSPLYYSWSSGQNTPAVNNLQAGTFTVTVHDQNLCSATASYSVTNAPDIVTFGTPVIVNDSCNGGSDGSISINTSGGTGNVTFQWSNFQIATTIGNLSAGTYSVTATDAVNCTASVSYTITQPTPIVFGNPVIDTPTCTIGGVVIAVASGGTGTISFTWSNNQSGNSISNVSAGGYIVTATDQNFCTATAAYTVPAGPGAITISPVITNVSCHGLNDGSVSIAPSGGNGALTATWSTTQTGNSISNLTAGNYSVTVSDNASCSASATYNVTEPNTLMIDSAHIDNIGCAGGLVGSVTAYPSGGTPTYSYSWVQQTSSQTHSGQTISGLGPDTYNVTVTDANSCSASGTYQVTQITPLTFSQSQTEVSCNGGNNGTAAIHITSGTPPYNFNWNNAGYSTDSTLTGISAGTVTVYIKDLNCNDSATFNISQPSAISISVSNQINASCNGTSDASISISVSGGTAPLNPVWSNSQTGLTAANLSAGQISVTVTDANSCTVSKTYTITQPTAVVVSITPDSALCYDAPNGMAVANASGGTAPYNYLWSDSQTTKTATGLRSENYFVTATDANSCTASAATYIGEPDDLVISAQGFQIKCIGDKNGYITVSATGGTPGYNFSATQDFANFVFATNGTIQNLDTGTYTVVVADNHGCTKTVTAYVPNATPDAFATITDSTSCYGVQYTDGAAHITATTILNSPYQYSIDSGEFSYSGDFYNLSAGEHVITAINSYGCVDTINIFVPEPLPIIVHVVPDSLILPLGESGQVQVVYLNASGVNYNWNPFTGLSCGDCPNPTVTVYESGDYVVTVSTENGACYGTATLHVDVEPHKPVFIPNSFSPNGDGNNDVFQIYGEDIKVIDLKIFNRWGEMVYKTNNALAGWDGTYKGVLQLPQVFVYTVEITFLDDKQIEKEGSITLLR